MAKTIADTKPAVLELEPGSYWWCQCGLSKAQPWCDGSHKTTEYTPLEVIVKQKRNYALCQCKQSANGAYCDGTHRDLP
jgi:CDGSH-type Zn-finger protein